MNISPTVLAVIVLALLLGMFMWWTSNVRAQKRTEVIADDGGPTS